MPRMPSYVTKTELSNFKKEIIKMVKSAKGKMKKGQKEEKKMPKKKKK